MTEKSLKKQRLVMVVIPKPLLKRIDRAAKALHVNRSALMRLAVERYIEAERKEVNA